MLFAYVEVRSRIQRLRTTQRAKRRAPVIFGAT